jgi:hypothetical protein
MDQSHGKSIFLRKNPNEKKEHANYSRDQFTVEQEEELKLTHSEPISNEVLN